MFIFVLSKLGDRPDMLVLRQTLQTPLQQRSCLLTLIILQLEQLVLSPDLFAGLELLRHHLVHLLSLILIVVPFINSNHAQINLLRIVHLQSPLEELAQCLSGAVHVL